MVRFIQLSRMNGDVRFVVTFHTRLQSSTTSTTLPPGGVTWDWRAVFNSADLHAGTSERSDGSGATWAWRLLLGTTASTNLEVQSSNSELLASHGDVLRGLHSGVRAVLVTIGLDLHATTHSRDGFLAGQVGDVNEGIVVGSVQVADTEDVLAIGHLGSESDDLLFLCLSLLWRHVGVC